MWSILDCDQSKYIWKVNKAGVNEASQGNSCVQNIPVQGKSKKQVWLGLRTCTGRGCLKKMEYNWEMVLFGKMWEAIEIWCSIERQQEAIMVFELVSYTTAKWLKDDLSLFVRWTGTGVELEARKAALKLVYNPGIRQWGFKLMKWLQRYKWRCIFERNQEGISKTWEKVKYWE